MSEPDLVPMADEKNAAPETEPSPLIADSSNPESPTDLVYSNEGFEAFLQQAELAGISRERQDELIVMFLSEDVALETILLDSIQRVVETLRRYKFRVLVLVVVLGLLGFVFVSEYKARRGYQEYQPWQFEMSALLRHWQLQVGVFLYVRLIVLFN